MLAAQARDVLGSTPGGCRPFFTFLYLRLITSNFIYLQLEARYSQQFITYLLSRRNDTNLFLVGKLRVGEMRVGEMRVGKLRVGEMRVGEMRVGEMRVGEMRVGEMRRSHLQTEWSTRASSGLKNLKGEGSERRGERGKERYRVGRRGRSRRKKHKANKSNTVF